MRLYVGIDFCVFQGGTDPDAGNRFPDAGGIAAEFIGDIDAHDLLEWIGPSGVAVHRDTGERFQIGDHRVYLGLIEI